MRDLCSMAGRVQTPAYIFDEDEFAARVRAVRGMLGSDARLCYSMKANPFLLRCLPEEVSLIEACSPGELTVCEESGIDMGRVIYSGVSKGTEDIRRAVADGTAAVTAESLLQYEMIRAAAAASGRRVPVLLRLTDGSQFGMDESDLVRIIAERELHPETDIRGIHYFTGTQKRRPGTVIRQLEKCRALILRLREDCSYETEWLEYGPGLDAEYFPEEGTADGSDASAAELERLEAVIPALHELSGLTHVCVELGRLLAAPCGVYLTGVADTKVNRAVHYAILDGGLHQMKYDGQLQGMQIPQMSVIRDGQEYRTGGAEVPAGAFGTDTEPWTLYGSLCSTSDVFARDARLPGLRTGDVIAFHRTGAYCMCEGITLFLSRDMPQIWLRTRDGELRLLRDRLQTWKMNM